MFVNAVKSISWSIILFYLAISNKPHACCVYDILSVSEATTVVKPHTTIKQNANKIGKKCFCWSTKHSIKTGSCRRWDSFLLDVMSRRKFDRNSIKMKQKINV